MQEHWNIEQYREYQKKGRFIYDLDEAGLLEEIDTTRLNEIKFNEFCELRKENKELKHQHEFAIKALRNQYKEQIEGLKETIVTMTVHSYNAQESFFNTIRNIDKKLDLILGGKK